MVSPEPALRSAVYNMFGNVAGVGLDLVDVALMTDLLASGGAVFVDAYWSRIEQAEAGDNVERLAGRWAAKEAVMKSLGTGIGAVDPSDVEVISNPEGAPVVRLHGPAAAIAATAGITECLVTITHEGCWAAAVAVAVQRTSMNDTLNGAGS